MWWYNQFQFEFRSEKSKDDSSCESACSGHGVQQLSILALSSAVKIPLITVMSHVTTGTYHSKYIWTKCGSAIWVALARAWSLAAIFLSSQTLIASCACSIIQQCTWYKPTCDMPNYSIKSNYDSSKSQPNANIFPEPDHTTGDDDGDKKKKGVKRRKVNHACLYCRRSHMTCDEGRPCQRWWVNNF